MAGAWAIMRSPSASARAVWESCIWPAHGTTSEIVAIKLIKRGMDTDNILRRFDNERRILESLSHPNIARSAGAGVTPEGLPYFVMEYVAGQPINTYCDSQQAGRHERLRLFEKVCSAVQCAHEANVIHRDIKPANILVTADGEPKLLDFGIAKVLNMATPTQDATVTILPVMTPHYASPEQARGAQVKAPTDIYSLGVLLYELLTGTSPYGDTGKSAASLVHAISYDVPSASKYRRGLDECDGSESRRDRRRPWNHAAGTPA